MIRRAIIVAVLLSGYTWAVNRQMGSAFPPNPPATGCPSGYSITAAGSFCTFMANELHHLDYVYVRVLSTDVDTGDANGGVPTFNSWSVADAKVKYFALYSGNGNTLSTTSNTTGVTTVTMTASSPFPLPSGAPICITGNSVAAYNSCFNVTGVTYSGNFLTSFTFNEGGSPASGAGGNVSFGCGDLLPGRSGISKCNLAFLVQHHQNNVATASSPVYPFSQAYANSSALAWTQNTPYGLRQSVKSSGFYCHNITAGGAGTSSTVAPNCNGSGTVTDGGITWQQDGANALPQEAICVSNYSGTANDANAATAGGTIINVNSAGAVTPPYSTTDVGTCNPLWTESPWRTWFKLFNTASNDGLGNPGVIYHYAGVAWEPQIIYVAIGKEDLSESFGWNNDKLMNVIPLTFDQYLAAYVDDYIGNAFKDEYAAWVASGATWQLNTRTNTCSTCGTLSKSLVYAQEIVTKAKAAYSGYSFGNQGVQVSDLTINAAGTWATHGSGTWPPSFDKYRAEANTVYHHLQPAASGDCPNPAALATLTCTNGGSHPCLQTDECTSTQITEGSMATWMPFAVQHGMSAFEGFALEVLATWDPNYTIANGLVQGVQPTYTDAQAENYQTIWNNAAIGLPASTSAISGAVKVLGNAVIQ